MLPYENAELSVEERVNDLMSRMTLTEKVGQLNQKLYGFNVYKRNGNNIELSDEFKKEVEKYSGLGTLYGLYRADPWANKDFETGLTGQFITKAYNEVQKYVLGHSRLHIPMLLSTECPHGHQALDGTLLPVNLSVGATFNPTLYGKACSEMGAELKSQHVDFALVSCLDMLRDPRWGRSEECYGEDPYLASTFAKEAVKGFQNHGLAMVAKHFCAQGEGTGGVNASAARIGTRELREIHLPTTKACVKAGLKGIMAAYNEIDGMPCHANKELLTNILRDEFGFNGLVMSDGVAIDQLKVIADTPEEQAALALRAGVDIGLWDEAYGHLVGAIEEGLVDISLLDEAVRRVLEFKFEQGLFEHPYIEDEMPSYSELGKQYSYELARESYVLLKNEDVLPLAGESIALIGNNADDFYALLGDYTPPFRENEQFSILNAFASEDKSIEYAKGCLRDYTDEKMLAEAKEVASKKDVCICVIGGSSSRFNAATVFDTNGAAITSNRAMDCGEGMDVSNVEIPRSQIELLKEVRKTTKKLITVVIAGRPYAISEVVSLSDAVIYGFYPGPYAGKALYEILLGKAAPSGRLPASLPRNAGQIPCYYNYRESYKAMHYSDSEDRALYPFGYGLSYGKCEYSNVSAYIQKPQENGDAISREPVIVVEFDICCTGKSSFAVPLAFVHKHGTGYVNRVKELKGFKKIALDVGEKTSDRIEIPLSSLIAPGLDERMASIDITLEDGGNVIYEGHIQIDN